MTKSGQIVKFPNKPKRVKIGPKVLIKKYHSPVYAGVPHDLPEGCSDPFTEYLDMNQELINNPDKTLIVTVRGDSMEPLLLDGDSVIVDETLKNNYLNNLCVVYIDGTATVKWVKKEKGKTLLIPENTAGGFKVEELISGPNYRVAGVVISMYRKFKPRL